MRPNSTSLAILSRKTQGSSFADRRLSAKDGAQLR